MVSSQLLGMAFVKNKYTIERIKFRGSSLDQSTFESENSLILYPSHMLCMY